MADFVTNRGAFRLGTGATVWNTGTIKALLLKSSASPDRTANFVADIVSGSSEISVAGYSRQTAGSKTTTEVDGSNRVEYDCADLTFSGLASGQTIGWLAFYHEVTNDADSPVLAILDLTDTPTNGGDVIVQINAAGAFTLNTA